MFDLFNTKQIAALTNQVEQLVNRNRALSEMGLEDLRVAQAALQKCETKLAQTTKELEYARNSNAVKTRALTTMQAMPEFEMRYLREANNSTEEIIDELLSEKHAAKESHIAREWQVVFLAHHCGLTSDAYTVYAEQMRNGKRYAELALPAHPGKKKAELAAAMAAIENVNRLNDIISYLSDCTHAMVIEGHVNEVTQLKNKVAQSDPRTQLGLSDELTRANGVVMTLNNQNLALRTALSAAEQLVCTLQSNDTEAQSKFNLKDIEITELKAQMEKRSSVKAAPKGKEAKPDCSTITVAALASRLVVRVSAEDVERIAARTVRLMHASTERQSDLTSALSQVKGKVKAEVKPKAKPKAATVGLTNNIKKTILNTPTFDSNRDSPQ